MKRPLAAALAALILTACAVGPDYSRPDVDTPQAWRFEEKDAGASVNARWWEQFGDPVLNEMIETALKDNKDLLIAAARIEEYRGRYMATRGNLFPQAGAGAAAARQRATQEGITGWQPGLSPEYSTYQADLNASWEIDLWGKLRRATEAARADLLAKEESRRAVLLSLAATVAGSYIDLRDLDRQLEIARRTVETRKESLDLFNMRFAGGVVSELELSQVKSEYESARAAIPKIEKTIYQGENALNFLLGRNPGPVKRGRSINELVVPEVPAGLPSDVLERRPDIRQAEQDLIAANARIGVARAAYFPSISLTGMFGSISTDLSNLFTGPAQAWNFGGTITMPIFMAGRLYGQEKATEAIQEQALIRYRQSVQEAFREVEDNLVDQRKTREIMEAQAAQVEALRSYRDLARLRYENGYSSYLEVLDADRNLFNMELTYVQTKGTLFRAMVNLYKSMGGGWEVEALEPSATPSGQAYRENRDSEPEEGH
ncbi:MAG TPA: efflux transporter outer membrane subunit [Syntrophales bacterium]|nr:efflux transporter outer membrane subunit [Syntrophales bacterium]